MVTVTQQERKELWIVSTIMDETSKSFGACQSWSENCDLPENYALISQEQMQEYYKKDNGAGKVYKSAGHCVMQFDDACDEDGHIIGKIVTSVQFSDELYDAYRNSLPNPVPGIIAGKINEAENKTNEIAAQGIAINSMNLATTFTNIDGEENPETDTLMYYNDANREEILKAFMACRAGLDNYTVKLSGKKAVSLPAELIYRMYIELETFLKMQNCYSEVYIKFLNSHKDDDRSQEDVISAYTYGETELPTELQTELETAQEAVMTEMQGLAEKLGING